MARGNLIQGYGRGKLGSTVYSISHGVQVSRVYNPAKFDRKSDSQIIRRAQWISASQYYSRAVASQFKFAFENKKPNESFQNAFMKRNWNRGLLIKNDDVSNPNYPSVGKYIVSEGSLRPIECKFDAALAFYFEVKDIDDMSVEPDTLGYLSRCLIAQGYRNGDIITFTVIDTASNAGSNSQPIIPGDTPPRYTFIQFRLDKDSVIKIDTMGLAFYEYTDIGHDGYIGIGADVDIDQFAICAGCVQVSRQLRSRLLVSYAELTLNTEGNKAMMYGTSNEWRQAVIDSWKSTGTALLQGGESENAADDSVVNILSDLTFPRTFQSLNSRAIVTNKILTPTQFGERIIFYKPNGEMYRSYVMNDGSVKINLIGSGTYSATVSRDSTNPYRWTIESTDTANTVQNVQATNI